MAGPAYSSITTLPNNTGTPRSFSGVSVAVGDLLVACVVSASTGGPNTYAVSDSLGHTWTKVGNANGLTGRSVEWWYAVVTSAGTSTVQVTATGGISWYGGLVKVLAVSGKVIQFDTADTFTDGVSTTAHPCAAVGNIDTAADVIVLASMTTSASASGFTDPAGFTSRAELLTNRTRVWTRESTSGLTDERAQWGSSASIQGLGSVVSFKAASAGGYTLAVDAATVSISMTAVGLRVSRALPVSPASVAVTTTPVILRVDRRLSVSPASVVITGQNVGLDYSGSGDKTLAVQGGDVSLTPGAVGLSVARRLIVEPANVTVTTGAVGLRADRRLSVSPVAVAITGGEVGLSYSGAAANVTPTHRGRWTTMTRTGTWSATTRTGTWTHPEA